MIRSTSPRVRKARHFNDNIAIIHENVIFTFIRADIRNNVIIQQRYIVIFERTLIKLIKLFPISYIQWPCKLERNFADAPQLLRVRSSCKASQVYHKRRIPRKAKPLRDRLARFTVESSLPPQNWQKRYEVTYSYSLASLCGPSLRTGLTTRDRFSGTLVDRP